MSPEAGRGLMSAMDASRLREHFERALLQDPIRAYRDWFRAQEELREHGEAELARALADDLWTVLSELPFSAAEEKARFLHNAAVFYGSPGPGADLSRARRLFRAALDHFAADRDSGWHARTLHNFATALSNLGDSVEDLAESESLFQEALIWRTSEREIARGVTLHNLGLARRRLAELDPGHAAAHLEGSAAALEQAVEIRERHGLSEGRAVSERQLAVTRERLEQARTRAGGATA